MSRRPVPIAYLSDAAGMMERDGGAKLALELIDDSAKAVGIHPND